MNQLNIVNASSNISLGSSLQQLENFISRAATQNVLQCVDSNHYNRIEIRAMIAGEKLRLINGLDLAAVIERGKVLRQMETENLVAAHPGGYEDIKTLAADYGLSASEYSNTRDFCDVIFPYIENVLGQSIAIVWENIGKSKMREMVPILKAIITGDDPHSETARQAVVNILNDVELTAVVSNEPLDENTRIRTAVEILLEQGRSMTNRQLRNELRPTRMREVSAKYLSLPNGRH